MLTGPRLFVGHDVKQEPNGPHVERDQDEAPFHHCGLGVIPKLVPSDVRRGGCGKRKPNNEKVIDRPNQHAFYFPLTTDEPSIAPRAPPENAAERETRCEGCMCADGAMWPSGCSFRPQHVIWH